MAFMRESPDGKRWIVKFYYAPGKQTTKTLGPKTQISRRVCRWTNWTVR